VVRAFGVSEAEVQPHLLVLEGEHHGLKMRKNSDQTLLFRQTVLNDLVADEEGLYAGFGEIRHRTIVFNGRLSAKGFLHFDAAGTKDGGIPDEGNPESM
jgi:hypothetical protein